MNILEFGAKYKNRLGAIFLTSKHAQCQSYPGSEWILLQSLYVTYLSIAQDLHRRKEIIEVFGGFGDGRSEDRGTPWVRSQHHGTTIPIRFR